MKQENSEIGKKVLTDGLDLGHLHHFGVKIAKIVRWNFQKEYGYG